MHLKDSRTGFGWVSIAFHWVSALVIVFLFGLGVYMRSLGYYDPWYHKGPALHISVGLLFAGLMLVRLTWRASNPLPADLDSNRLQNLAAKLMKWAFYLLILVVLASGYMITTAEGEAADVFGWFAIPPFAEFSADTVDFVGAMHKYLAWTIIGLAIVHSLAALYHHFVKRDRTLVRMLKP